jgi:hypothetical protein
MRRQLDNIGKWAIEAQISRKAQEKHVCACRGQKWVINAQKFNS